MWERLRGILSNRWALAGVAVAGGAGLYMLVRRSRGDAGAGSGAQESPGYASGAVGGFDSTGTDVAHWLGSQSGMLDAQLREWTETLTGALAGLQQMQPTAPEAPATYERLPVPRKTGPMTVPDTAPVPGFPTRPRHW